MSDNFANNSNMTALMTAIGNKIKNAAHTIYNSAGTALTKRSKLKFTGRMKVTDDSTNGQTVVDDSPEHIDWDDWCAMTEQQQAAVKEAVIDNAPGVDGGLTANLLTKLWENPNPNSDFANQNITSSISGSILNYKFFILTYKKSSSDTMLKSMIIPLGSSNLEWEEASNSTGVDIVKRGVVFSAVNGSVVINSAVVYSSVSQAVVNNSKVIPLTIYGLKESINLKFSAIASDVSTSADKCMMSDGVTSVEDAITNREIKFLTHTGTTDETANLILPLTKENARVLAAYGIGEGSATLKSLIGGLAMMTTGGNWFVHVIDYRGTARTSEEVSITVAYIDLQE